MAICNPTGSLTVTISENITLPNGNIESALNTKVIKDVNQIMRRTDTISTTFSGSGIEILRFVDSEEQQTAGSFVRDTVKYMRFTNLCSHHYCSIYLIQDSPDAQSPNTTDFGSGDNGIFKLDPGKSLVFSNGQFDSNNYYDYVVEGYVDEQYFGSFSSLTSIKAKADEADVQIEYFIASS